MLKTFFFSICCCFALLSMQNKTTEGSVDILTKLFDAKNEIIQYITEFSEKHKNSINMTTISRIKAYYEELTPYDSDRFEFVKNPTNAILLTQKFVVYQDRFKKLFSITSLSESMIIDQMIASLSKQKVFSAFRNVTQSFIRLVHNFNIIIDIYKLDYQDAINGRFYKNKISYRPLDAYDCFELAEYSLTAGQKHHAYNWIMNSLKLLQNKKLSIDSEDIYKFLYKLALSQENYYEAYNYIHLLQTNHTKTSDQFNFIKVFYEENKDKIENAKDTPLSNERDLYNVPKEYLKFEEMCRSDKPLMQKAKLNLKCQYLRDTEYLSIAPMKEETLSLSPSIKIYHQVITQTMADSLKKKSLENFDLSMTDAMKLYIIDSIDKNSRSIDRHIWQIIKGAFVPFPKLIQNSHLGGFTRLEIDCVTKPESGACGDCYFTFISTLQEAESGGEIVFLYPKIKLKLPARSILAYKNLHDDYSKDLRLVHGFCPILYGSRWEVLRSPRNVNSKYDMCELSRGKNKNYFKTNPKYDFLPYYCPCYQMESSVENNPYGLIYQAYSF